MSAIIATAQSKPVNCPRIALVTSRALGEMLDDYNETYTFVRMSGAVEHRSWDGALLAISINGKHYVDRLSTPSPSPVKLVQ
ncbi:hypothetical protein [Pseudomonas sp. Q1]|uniref:hypothetical protein n=1 Tax=Pseudomonas sp. Q1 TaxID=2202823 RepID=UPI001374AF81|nr:hypothetical protein [Pseudomonas sp. Q1]NCE85269.1 hypothetical protein [Pseudomonas sp. Q1]